jgi:transposase-like protein
MLIVSTEKAGCTMAHCPSCGKEIGKPSRELKNYSFTIQAFYCEKCHHDFKVTINQSVYM